MTPPDAPPATPLARRVGIVGAGLIGTSLGLALRDAGVDVLLADSDPQHVEIACLRGAGRPWNLGSDARFLSARTGMEERVDGVFIAVPPAATQAVIDQMHVLTVTSWISDTGSLKSHLNVEGQSALLVPGHPVAGRERSGPTAARPGLFRDRPWALCPLPHTDPRAVQAVEVLVRACGAVPVRTSTSRHDAALAVLSHVPQLVASAVADTLRLLDDDDLALAGPGFKDLTRTADSDPALWEEIVGGNARPVAAALDAVLTHLQAVRDAVEGGRGGSAARRVVAAGREARRRLPDKPGQRAQGLALLEVEVPDRPGELARLLALVGDLEVNLEDVRVEHGVRTGRGPGAPAGRPVGLAQLSVLAGVADALVSSLAAHGWRAERQDRPAGERALA